MEVKSNIGELSKDTQAIIEAIKGAKKETKELSKETEGVGKSSAKSVSGVKKLTGAFGGLMKSLGVVAIVASVFTTLKEALERNQKVMNAVNTVMTTVSTTFNQVANVLVDVYDWVTKSSDRFDGLTKVISGLMTIALTPLKLSFYAIKLGVEGAMLAWEDSFLGGGDEGKIAALRLSMAETANDIKEVGLAAIDAGKDIGNNIGDAIGEIGAIAEVAIDGISKISVKANYEQAKATTAAQNSSKLAEAQIQGLIEKNDLLSETQRQIRDDETKTFAERIAANKELGDILDKQEVDMMKLADTRVASAKLELDANKENIELQVAYQQTLNDRAGVEAQVAGFRSEQLTNEVSLNKELLETQNEVRAEGLSGLQRELEELKTAYELKKEMARKSGMDTTAIEKEFNKQKSLLIQENVNTQVEAFSGLAGALSSLAGENKALAVASAVIDTYVGANKAFAQGGVAGFATGAAIIAAGLNNVKTIMQTDVPNSGGGGGGGVSAPAAPPAPQMMSGAFELSGGVEPEPTKAYVVTDEMTNSQNQLANIRRRATI